MADELKVRSEKLRKAGLAIAGIMGGVIFGIVALTVPFVLPALRKYCLPYVPATPIQTETVLRHIRGRAGRVVDLGSGDGRVVHNISYCMDLCVWCQPYVCALML